VPIPFSRPVKAGDLFATPEMQIRHPNESERSHEAIDEGVGRAFDNMDPSAAATREVSIAGDIGEFLDHYQARLRELGWEGTVRRDEFWADAHFHRGSDESISVQVAIGPEESLAQEPGESRSGRVTYLVQGEWQGNRPRGT
jgi:hypothetical protein